MAKKTKRTLKKRLKHKKSNEERYIQLANDYIILCDKAIKMKNDIEERRMACSAVLESNNYKIDAPHLEDSPINSDTSLSAGLSTREKFLKSHAKGVVIWLKRQILKRT